MKDWGVSSVCAAPSLPLLLQYRYSPCLKCQGHFWYGFWLCVFFSSLSNGYTSLYQGFQMNTVLVRWLNRPLSYQKPQKCPHSKFWFQHSLIYVILFFIMTHFGSVFMPVPLGCLHSWLWLGCRRVLSCVDLGQPGPVECLLGSVSTVITSDQTIQCHHDY